MYRLLLLPVFLLLAGCFDIDFALDFTSRDDATATAEIRMPREVFDMIGQTPAEACEDGVAELTEEAFTCTVTESGSIEELMSGEFGDGMEMENGMSVTREGDDRVRVVFDIATIMTEGDAPSPEEMQEMSEMLTPLLEGRVFTFLIRGAEILESTGDISEDGTMASRSIPLSIVLEENPDYGPAFETLVRLP